MGLPGRTPANGLALSLLDVSVAADRTVTVHFGMQDSRRQWLPPTETDLLGFEASEVVLTAARAPDRYRAFTVCPASAPHADVMQPCMDFAVRATTVATARLRDRGDGTWDYRLTAALPATYDPTHTLSISAQARRQGVFANDPASIANAVLDVVPAGGTPVAVMPVSQASGCNNCHGSLAAHGGTRNDLRLCVRCHTAELTDPDTGTSLDLRTLVHKIHRGRTLPSVVAGTPLRAVGFNGAVSDWSHLRYPQDLRNCNACHNERAADAPDAARWATQPTVAVCTSCHDNIYMGAGTPPAGTIAHPGGVSAASECTTCHRENFSIGASPTGVRTAHQLVDLREGAPTIAATIDGVTNGLPGRSPTVTFTLTDRAGVPITNAANPPPATTPPSASLTGAVTRVTLNLNGATVPDYGLFPVLGGSVVGATPVGTLTNLGAGHYQYAFPATTVLPTTATGTWAVGLEARRVEYLAPTSRVPTASLLNHGVFNPVRYFSTDGSPVAPRRQVVEVARCNACHQQLAAHGSNRQNPEYCVFCHSPGGVDNRPALNGGPQSIEFQAMIHRIHMGASLPSVVAGGAFAYWGSATSRSDFADVRFPRSPASCAACHAAGTSETPRTAACTSCHDDPSALAHAQINTSAAGVEACNVCHGPGRLYSVSAMHAPAD
jgi:OmcA/MtrC family decaheme c-type cytochrome